MLQIYFLFSSNKYFLSIIRTKKKFKFKISIINLLELFIRANGPCYRESRLVSVEGWPAHATDWSNPPFSQTNADPSGMDFGRWAISPIRVLTRYTLAKIGLHSREAGRTKHVEENTLCCVV